MDAEILEKLSNLPIYAQMIRSNDTAQQLEATQSFRKVLSIDRNPPISAVIEHGVVPVLVEFLKRDGDPNLQFEAAWALTNIASGSSQHTQVVIQSGAIPIFVALLKSPFDEVKEQAVWALGNTAGDSPACRDIVLHCNIMPNLLALCSVQSRLGLLRNACWTLSNLCRGKPQPDFQMVSQSLPVLADLLYIKDEEVLMDVCWALSYLSDDTGPNNDKIQAVINAGVPVRLVELLLSRSNNVKTPALRTVGNIVTGDDLQTQIMINVGLLPAIGQLMISGKRNLRKEACWTVSNITAGNSAQIQEVINAGIIPHLINLLIRGEFDVKKEAAWALSNSTSSGTDEQIHYLVEQGIIPPLCALFKSHDAKVAIVALEGLDNILKVGQRIMQHRGLARNPYAVIVETCDGLDLLENLQHHSLEELFIRSSRILREFFEAVPVSDTGVGVEAPEQLANNQGFSFNMNQANPPNNGYNFQNFGN